MLVIKIVPLRNQSVAALWPGVADCLLVILAKCYHVVSAIHRRSGYTKIILLRGIQQYHDARNQCAVG